MFPYRFHEASERKEGSKGLICEALDKAMELEMRANQAIQIGIPSAEEIKLWRCSTGKFVSAVL